MHAPTSTTNGRRPEARVSLVVAGSLHRDGGIVQDVAVIDLTPHGCRTTGAGALAPGSYVTLVLGGNTIIAGRIAWADENAAGIDFCQALRPRALAQVLDG